MLSAGIDIGSHSAKAVVFDGRSVLGGHTLVSEDNADTAARNVFHAVLTVLGLKEDSICNITATGWGRRQVSFAGRASSELICASRGARWLVPNAGTVVDIGTEGCRAMRLKPNESRLVMLALNSRRVVWFISPDAPSFLGSRST